MSYGSISELRDELVVHYLHHLVIDNLGTSYGSLAREVFPDDYLSSHPLASCTTTVHLTPLRALLHRGHHPQVAH